MRSISCTILLFFTFAVLRINAQVQEQRYMKSLAVGSIAANGTSTITVKDPVDVNRYAEKSYKVLVKLVYGREGRTDVRTQTFSYGINYSLAFLNQQGQVNAVTQNGDALLLTYNGTAASNTEVYQSLPVPTDAGNWCGTTLTVTGIPTNITPPSDVRLEVHLICTYRLTPDLLLFQGALSYNGTSKEFVWQYQRGASAYQLEWVYIDNESVFSPVPATAADYFLLKEPVRVMVKEQYFHFEPKYAAGKVYARVRAVWQYGGDANNQPHYCAWQYLSSPTQINIVNTVPGINEIQAFEVNKTWQYTAQYAENGKSAQAVSYFDGSLRARQSIALMNSENVEIVSETLYDYEGRPVINVMPYPVAATSMNYRFRDNMFQGEGTVPNKGIYDKPYTGSSSVAMDSASGAANYYSSSNTITGARNTINAGYIPRAKGYAYSQVQYMQDGTGRPTRQNMPGEAFVLNAGGGNYTGYYYDQAKPMELQRLFGKNVGNALHYQKNYVMDNNGQVSVTYIDQFGKVVATALAGDAPKRNGTTVLSAIQDNTAAPITVSLSAQNKYDAATGTLTSVNKQMNMIAGTSYALHYDVKGVIDNATATFTSCNACSYDLEIVITSPDGTVLLPKYSLTNLSASSLNCSATNFPITPVLDVPTLIFNQVGTYTITKKLTLNKASMDVLTASIAASPLAPNLAAITATYRAAVDYSSCDLTCRDRALSANPIWDPNSPSYVYNINNETYIKTWIKNNNCDNAQAIIEADQGNPCASMLQLMIEELPSLGLTDVTLHPEHCHYLACVRETASRLYDMKMASVANWTDAVAAGYYSPLANMSTQTSPYGSVAGNLDPLFNTTDFTSPGTFKTKLDQMKTSATNSCLTNYMNTTKTLWQYANDPASYPLGGATAFNALSAEEQDAQKWRTFSGAYQGLKQQLIYELKTTVGNAWTCAYRNSENAIVQDPSLIRDAAVLQTKMDAEQTSGCGDLCDLNAKTWLANLIEGGCSTPALTETEKATVITYLKNYCIANCGASNPWGLLLSRHITDVRGSSDNSKPGYSDLRAALTILDAKISCDLLNTSYIDPYVYSGGAVGSEVPTQFMYDVVSATNALLSEARSPQNIITSCPVSGNPLFTHKAYTKKNTSNVTHRQYNFYTSDLPINGPSYVNTPYVSIVDDPNIKFQFYNTQNDSYRPYMFIVMKPAMPLLQDLCGVGCQIKSNNQGGELAAPYVFVTYNSTTGNYTLINKANIYSISNPQVQILPAPYAYTFSNVPQSPISKSIKLDAVLLDVNNQQYNSTVYFININSSFTYMNFSFNYDINQCNLGHSGDGYNMFKTQTAATPVTGFTPCSPSVQPATGPKNFCGTTVTVSLPTLRQQCRTEQLAAADYLAQQKYEEALQTFTTTFLTNHVATCFNSNLVENFTLQYANKEYQYTLYYYDHAGNLVATVPPEGVYPLTATSFTNGVLNTGAADPVHKLQTYYRYNSVGQLVSQESPDGGLSNFFYDSKGQLRLSQNAEQKYQSTATVNRYSYSKYDAQGRTIESGDIQNLAQTSTYFSDPATRKVSLVLLDNLSFPNGNIYKDVSKTTYDIGTGQNLRNRVAVCITLNDGVTANNRTTYSYDVHGNVKRIIQEAIINQPKIIDFCYDLSSGALKRLDYQKGFADQYAIKYSYDANIRLRNVYSSFDNGLSWKEDAEHFYYLHGPLARIEYGQSKVQGMDYAYTLQGWKKMVNTTHERIKPVGKNYHINTKDIGNDGMGTGVNQYVAQDEFAFALGYHNKDYSAIGGIAAPLGLASNASGALSAGIAGPGLYNGNITWQITQLNRLAEMQGSMNENFGIRAAVYQYDQLNRLKQANNYILSVDIPAMTPSATLTPTTKWNATYGYDRNGNLMNATVNGNTTVMDQFTYNYARDANQRLTTNNRLNSVSDGANLYDATYATDINSGQGASNYTYDKIGNLIGDAQDGSVIEWTASGKVRKVIKASVVLEYNYDAGGNRVSKKATYSPSGSVTLTTYLRDAGGNVIATYIDNSLVPVMDIEYNLYGAGRIGRVLASSIPRANVAVIQPESKVYQYKPGNYQYELGNHLGNVQAVITGLKLGEDTDGNALNAELYRCSVVGLSDYYSFGMEIEGRTYVNVNAYRYGFNGKEKDAEGMGGGGSTYDYGFRIYNPALGKFLSVDPLTKSYPWYTPYQFAGNKPINCIDLDGLEEIEVHSADITGKIDDMRRMGASQTEIENYVNRAMDIHEYDTPKSEEWATKHYGYNGDGQIVEVTNQSAPLTIWGYRANYAVNAEGEIYVQSYERYKVYEAAKKQLPSRFEKFPQFVPTGSGGSGANPNSTVDGVELTIKGIGLAADVAEVPAVSAIYAATKLGVKATKAVPVVGAVAVIADNAYDIAQNGGEVHTSNVVDVLVYGISTGLCFTPAAPLGIGIAVGYSAYSVYDSSTGKNGEKYINKNFDLNHE